MKRNAVITLLITAFCYTSDAQKVSLEDAAGRALSFFNTSVSQQGRKMAAKKDVTLHYTASRGDETHFYVFNKVGGGWVIVGGDEVCRDIIAFSETGTFDYANAPSNLRNWLAGYEAEISDAIAATTIDGARNVKKTAYATAKAGDNISAMIQTHWNQTEPYWNVCPMKNSTRCLTGCVATAMAQVMYFWQWPKVGTGSKSYYDYGCKKTLSTTFSAHTYDWAEMQLETKSYTTSAQENAVAQLMYDCGVSVAMEYGTEDEGGSGAYSEDIPTALTTYFGYQSTAKYVMKSSYSTDNWVALIYAELAAGRPVLYAGATGNGSDASGHQFVCDGYQYSGSTHMFHFNWGWSGEEDGFFSLTSLGKSYNFKYGQDAIIGVQPKETKIYTVTLADDGTSLKPSAAGGTVSLPARTLPGYTFVGWANNGGISEATTTKPTILSTTYTPTADVTIYPVYSYIKRGESGGSATVELLSEDFGKLTTGSNTDTSRQSNSKWSGNSNIITATKAYPASGMVKLGSGNAGGSMTTKPLTVAAGTQLTVRFDVKGWSKVEGSICVGVTDCSDQIVTYSATMSQSPETKSVTFVTASANPQVTIATTSKRAFIDNLTVTSGSGTPDETYYCSYLTMATAQMTITSAKWATFYAPDDVELENEVYAYAVTLDGSEIRRQPVARGDASTVSGRTVPAHTPVILYKDVTSTYTKDYDTYFSSTPSPVSDNCLVGTLVPIAQLPVTTEANTNYVLQLGADNKVTWFSAIYDDVNEKYNSIVANRAYLSVPTGTSVKGIFDEVTSIETLSQHPTSGSQSPTVNLNGQTVDDSYRGIIINNGCKILRR